MGGTTSIIYSGAVEAAAGTIVSGAVSSITSTFKMQEGLDVTLYSLQQELMKIQCVINAARRRQVTDQKLLEWLAQIIDASYLGNYYYRTFKHQNSLPSMIESESMNNLAVSPTYRATKRRRIIRTLLFGDKEYMKLHNVLKMLKSIDTSAFLLIVNAQPERSMRTYLYMEHNRLLNRDEERQQVMNFLFESGRDGENNVTILPIVGSGGGGKTSLALHCFYDPEVQNNFSLKMYIDPAFISYSKTFEFSFMMKEILEQYNNSYTTNYDDVNTMLVMLKQKLSSEKFLLVLDDLPGYVDPMAWNALWDCLRCGGQGSKVILISRTDHYERYKNIVNPKGVMPVMVDGFSEDEYMLFFIEHAFGGVDPEDYPELAKLGREIATKMNGSIWGAKILGELLRDNLTVPFWSKFLQGDILSPLERGDESNIFHEDAEWE
ncbi:hypothetical protein LUZ61_017076 [Rhynchospora tenuis]|uniref:NB-ARC domain-containing protein n=1 Tax=Rhynchospora tenuis TaxID=198213 RepID=A0AAD5Z6P7_9POAL|nr:hypothetical protein LUZ61_017076 [Rhynchospora tenuis]